MANHRRTFPGKILHVKEYGVVLVSLDLGFGIRKTATVLIEGMPLMSPGFPAYKQAGDCFNIVFKQGCTFYLTCDYSHEAPTREITGSAIVVSDFKCVEHTCNPESLSNKKSVQYAATELLNMAEKFGYSVADFKAFLYAKR